jgi:hypothetical protein
MESPHDKSDRSESSDKGLSSKLCPLCRAYTFEADGELSCFVCDWVENGGIDE